MKNLAIAYNVQKKNKKKPMSKGGKVELSANDESRPSPETEGADSSSVVRNRGNKPPHLDNWLDNTGDASKPGTKMAKGGAVKQTTANTDKMVTIDDQDPIEEESISMQPGKSNYGLDESEDYIGDDEQDHYRMEADRVPGLAHGGMMGKDGYVNSDDEDGDMVDMIMKRRKAKMMADGGQVSLEENNEEQPNNEDQLSYNAIKKEPYDLSQLSSQPEDSNEEGDEAEMHAENAHDAIDKMRMKLRARRG